MVFLFVLSIIAAGAILAGFIILSCKFWFRVSEGRWWGLAALVTSYALAFATIAQVIAWSLA